jgi:hypothetical protein
MRGWLPRLLLVSVVASIASVVTPANAGWDPNGATIKATSATIPRVAACSDGQFGTFVVWYEESAPGQGDLRALHVLSTGDVDPAWPATGLVIACGPPTAAPPLMGTFPDGLGGFYAWWKADASLQVVRVEGTGQVATNWECGLWLGMTPDESPMPSFIEDGANGFYAAWVEGSVSPLQVYGVHVGPDGTDAGSWPGARALSPRVPPVEAYWPRLALAPDGGVFLAWGSWSPDTTVTSSVHRLRRLTSAGLNSPGWTTAGLSFGSFHRELMGSTPASALIDVCPDGRGGVFLAMGQIVGTDFAGTGQPYSEHRLYRLQGNGQSADDWPSAGRLNSQAHPMYPQGGPPEGSLRVFSDGQDGLHPGSPNFYTHGPAYFAVNRMSASGQWLGGSVEGILVGHEVFAKGNGGLAMAEISPHGPTGPYQPPALIAFSQTVPSNGFGEYDDTHFLPKYGDVAIAPTGDGGSVFFWSQVRERFGLFARRFTPGGQVTGIEAVPASLGLRGLRFVSGMGVRAAVSVPAGISARLELFDLAGRRLASQGVEGGPVEITLAGTSTLRSGLYFARLVTPRGVCGGRVAVTR